MADWLDVGDFTQNPYFGSLANGDSGGSGSGVDYFNFSDESLGLGELPFEIKYDDEGVERSRYDPAMLNKYLADNGYSLKQMFDTPSNSGARALFDRAGNQIGNSQAFNQNDSNFSLASSALFGAINPFGGMIAGPTSGFGGLGTLGKGLNAAVGGGFGTGYAGGDPLKGALTAGLSSGLPSLGNNLGITNPTLSNMFDSTVKGAGRAAIAGGNVLQGALSSAIPAGLNALGEYLMPEEMPDVGTLGGTMQDEFGESSATMGGFMPPAQFEANNQVASMQEEDNSPVSRVMKALGFDSGRTSFNLPSINSGQIGDLAQGLAGLYGGYRQRRQAKEMMNLIGGRRGAYEENLRRNLQRKDAAQGRRSDYAGRETQLQAALAELDSRNAPAMMQLNNMRSGGLADMFRSALFTGDKLGLLRSSSPTTQPGYNLPTLPNLPSLTNPMTQNPMSAFDDYLKKLGGG